MTAELYVWVTMADCRALCAEVQWQSSVCEGMMTELCVLGYDGRAACVCGYDGRVVCGYDGRAVCGYNGRAVSGYNGRILVVVDGSTGIRRQKQW